MTWIIWYEILVALYSNVVPCRNDYAMLDDCMFCCKQRSLSPPFLKDGGWRSGDYKWHKSRDNMLPCPLKNLVAMLALWYGVLLWLMSEQDYLATTIMAFSYVNFCTLTFNCDHNVTFFQTPHPIGDLPSHTGISCLFSPPLCLCFIETGQLKTQT